MEKDLDLSEHNSRNHERSKKQNHPVDMFRVILLHFLIRFRSNFSFANVKLNNYIIYHTRQEQTAKRKSKTPIDRSNFIGDQRFYTYQTRPSPRVYTRYSQNHFFRFEGRRLYIYNYMEHNFLSLSSYVHFLLTMEIK